MEDKYLTGVLGNEERSLMKIFRWCITEENFTFLQRVFQCVKSVQNPTEKAVIADFITEKQLNFSDAEVTLEKPIEDFSSEQTIGLQDLVISWPDSLSIVFEAKISTLPNNFQKTRGDIPSSDPYRQIQAYLDSYQDRLVFLISITPDKEDLLRLNRNLVKMGWERIKNVFWVSWEDIQQVTRSLLEEIRNKLDSGQITLDETDIIVFIKLNELDHAIKEIVYQYRTDVLNPSILDVFRENEKSDSPIRRKQLIYFTRLFHQQIEDKLPYMKESSSIDSQYPYGIPDDVKKPERRFWIGFWESIDRYNKSNKRSPNILIEYRYNFVHLAIYHGDSIATLRELLKALHEPENVNQFFKHLNEINGTFEVVSQAFDRTKRHLQKDVCDSEPYKTQSMTREQFKELIQFMQEYQQEQEGKRERKTGFRIGIKIADMYSEQTLEELEVAFNQLYPIYQFLLKHSGLKQYLPQ